MNFNKTYRGTIAFIFSILFCIETFYSIFIVADYYAETEAYATNCINKSMPQMHCNGKCQLQKKIKETNNKDQQDTQRKIEAGINIFLSKNFYASVETLFSTLIKQKYFIINEGTVVDNAAQCFHPPQNFYANLAATA